MKKAKKMQNISLKIAILGFGKEGQSTLKYLEKTRAFKNAEIWICDKNKGLKIPARYHKKLGENYLTELHKFDIVFRSPGIPYLHPEIQNAKRAGTIISSATKLFFAEIYSLKNPPKIIGITGSKGKGTTSTLIAKILSESGEKVILAGNIGRPMLDALSKVHNAEIIVLELSSFQLQDLLFSPHIAVVLDIFPDHLDHHKHVREYVNAKVNIGKFQKRSDMIFYFANKHGSQAIAKKSPAQKISVLPTSQGLHKNYDMAISVTRKLGVSEKTIKKAILNFHGLEHRLEHVRTLQQHTDKLKNVGISFYNDSAATNPEATAAAIRTLTTNNQKLITNVILIIGGRDKGLPYKPLIQAAKESKNLKFIFLIGENKHTLKRALTNKKYQIITHKTLADAVKHAYKSAQLLVTNYQLPVTVLFSPASTSFDMFKNYAERGKIFKKLVHSLSKK